VTKVGVFKPISDSVCHYFIIPKTFNTKWEKRKID